MCCENTPETAFVITLLRKVYKQFTHNNIQICTLTIMCISHLHTKIHDSVNSYTLVLPIS